MFLWQNHIFGSVDFMGKLLSIKIDLDVYKKLVSEMLEGDRDQNDTLHRLLKVPFSNGSGPSVTATAWSDQGVSLPEGTPLRFKHLGREHRGEIRGGAFIVEGARYYSPSAAAEAVARTRTGGPTSLDGWKYWQAELPGAPGGWISLENLRRRARGLDDLKPKHRRGSKEIL